MEPKDLIEVMQADRERAMPIMVQLFSPTSDEIDDFRSVIWSGKLDDHFVVQAFARHRIASVAAARPFHMEEAWQPIEMAPRDGTEIILYGLYPEGEGLPTQRITAGFWLEPEPPVVGDCGGECRCPEYGEPDEPHWASMHGGSDQGWMSTDGGFTKEWPATHWQPLPAPPRTAGSKSDD